MINALRSIFVSLCFVPIDIVWLFEHFGSWQWRISVLKISEEYFPLSTLRIFLVATN